MACSVPFLLTPEATLPKCCSALAVSTLSIVPTQLPLIRLRVDKLWHVGVYDLASKRAQANPAIRRLITMPAVGPAIFLAIPRRLTTPAWHPAGIWRDGDSNPCAPQRSCKLRRLTAPLADGDGRNGVPTVARNYAGSTRVATVLEDAAACQVGGGRWSSKALPWPVAGKGCQLTG